MRTPIVRMPYVSSVCPPFVFFHFSAGSQFLEMACTPSRIDCKQLSYVISFIVTCSPICILVPSQINTCTTNCNIAVATDRRTSFSLFFFFLISCQNGTLDRVTKHQYLSVPFESISSLSFTRYPYFFVSSSHNILHIPTLCFFHAVRPLLSILISCKILKGGSDDTVVRPEKKKKKRKKSIHHSFFSGSSCTTIVAEA